MEAISLTPSSAAYKSMMGRTPSVLLPSKAAPILRYIVDTFTATQLSTGQLNKPKEGWCIAPGLGKAIKKHAIGHLVGTVGTGLCGVAAVGEGGLNLIADAGTLAFGAWEVYELAETADEASKLRDEARKAFAVCLMNCARQWHDFDGAYDFWEIYK